MITDGRWRPEPHPLNRAKWVLMRYEEFMHNSSRNIARSCYLKRGEAVAFATEKAAQFKADILNSRNSQ